MVAKKVATKITVIEPNNFYECDITMAKGLSNPDKYESNFSCPQYQIQVDGIEYIEGLVQSVVKEADNSFTITLKNGDAVKADAVVVCTGFSNALIKPAPGTTYDSRKAALNSHRAAIASADIVLIGGGGAVGVDVNGEILDMLKPGGKITHVVSDSAQFLSPRHSAAERKLVTDRVCGFSSCDVKFGEKVVNGGKDAVFEKGKVYKLKSGATVTADVYIPSFAVFDRAQFLEGVDGALAMNGTVAVDKASLMSTKMFNLFAVGCSDNGEMCSIPKIEAQAKSVVKNLELTLKGGQPTHRHKEAIPFYKAEGLVPHGLWGMIATDELGAIGYLCCMCGFPFPCCLGPCVDPCGVCGTSCSKPVGKGPGGFWDFAMNMGPFGPVLGKANKKRVPAVEGMDRS